MQKVKRSVIAIVLTVSLSFCSLVPAHALQAALGIAGFVMSALDVLNDVHSDAQDKARARDTLYYSWSNFPVTSSSRLIRVSGDTLSDLVAQLSQNGIPCSIEYSSAISSTNISGYWIKCTGEPHAIYDPVELLDSSHTYTGKHFGVQSDGGGSTYWPTYIYSPELPSSSYLKTMQSTLTSISGFLSTMNNNIVNAINSLVPFLDGIEGYIDGIESYLSSQANKLSTIVSNTSYLSDIATNTARTIYVGGYTTFSDGTAYSVITLKYSSFDALIAALNENFSGRSISYLARDTSDVISTRTFLYAYKYNNRIRVAFQSDSNVQNMYLQTLDHHFIECGSETDSQILTAINSLSAYVDQVEGYVDGIEGLLSSINSKISDSTDPIPHGDLYIGGYTTFSDGTAYPSVTLKYSSFESLIASLNASFSGRDINYLARDTSDVAGTRTFLYAYKYNNRIRIAYLNGSNVLFSYLFTKNHCFIESGPEVDSQTLTAVNSLSGVVDTLSDHLDTHFSSFEDHMSDIEDALSNLNDTASMTLEELQNIQFPENTTFNDIWHVGTDDNSNDQSILDVSRDASRIFGRLLSFLYDLAFKDALSDNGLVDLADFYLDSSEGVEDIWGS